MGVRTPPFDWAGRRFGEHADDVRRSIAEALMEAMSDAQDAQRSSRSDKQYAYGSTLMARRYETIAARFGGRPDVQVIKPHASAHELTVIDGNVLFPFRYSKDGRTPIAEARISDGRVSGLIRELFRRFGPEPTYEQEALDLFADEETPDVPPLRPALARLPDDTRLVLIAYAGNAHAGLFNAYWGEAELIDEFGRIRWTHYEPIPLLVPAAYSGRHLVATGYVEGRSADEEPGVPLTARRSGESADDAAGAGLGDGRGVAGGAGR